VREAHVGECSHWPAGKAAEDSRTPGIARNTTAFYWNPPPNFPILNASIILLVPLLLLTACRSPESHFAPVEHAGLASSVQAALNGKPATAPPPVAPGAPTLS